jgi:predicted neuraminidase
MNRNSNIRFFSVSVCVLGLTAIANAEQQGMIKSEFIFEEAPHPQCHASTIVETQSGLVVAWFGGTKEGNPDVGIWLSRHRDGKWSLPIEVAHGAETEEPRVNCLNPVLFQVRNGPLLLFYKTGNWWAYVKRSFDEGVTWSKPERLYNGLFGPVNEGHEIQAIQPSILSYPNNRLQALGRTQQGRLFEIWSDDGGLSWGKMSLMDLPNNNSGTDAVTLRLTTVTCLQSLRKS